MILGKSVRLFLIDGNQSGVVTAEIINWTGQILVSPRSAIGAALKRDEASRTGIYFLVGDDPDQPSKKRVYIGEADVVADRIRSHAKDDTKDFWTQACFVTSKDTNLTKGHARYLESRLVELAKQAGRANLANGNAPGARPLPESDVSDMEFFLSQMKVVLPVLGFDFLVEKPQEDAPSSARPTGVVELEFASAKHGVEASAFEEGGKITVRAGAKAQAHTEFAMNQYGSLREQLVAEGRLRPTEDGQFLIFAEDITFDSPSAAAAVILNRNANGRTRWKLKGTQQTLRDWQDAQLDSD